MNALDLLKISFGCHKGFLIQIGPLLILLLAVMVVVLVVLKHRYLRNWRSWSPVESEILLGGIGKVRIKPSYDEIQIAHKAWVELVTRKAGIPFDPQHDVISEIYDSWYQLFQEMRALAKTVPAEKVRLSSDTQQLVRLLIDALNEGLRPHLTKWQARFRHWYEEERKEHPEKSPQEIQRGLPQYQELVEDLLKVNQQILQYADFIRKIAQGESEEDH